MASVASVALAATAAVAAPVATAWPARRVLALPLPVPMAVLPVTAVMARSVAMVVWAAFRPRV
jgi:hypothetical protein